MAWLAVGSYVGLVDMGDVLVFDKGKTRGRAFRIVGV